MKKKRIITSGKSIVKKTINKSPLNAIACHAMKLVFIAFLVAAPLAWLFMNKWLQGFTYRENMAWWVFVMAGLGAISIALVTIVSQFIRAAIANPVQSLKVE